MYFKNTIRYSLSSKNLLRALVAVAITAVTLGCNAPKVNQKEASNVAPAQVEAQTTQDKEDLKLLWANFWEPCATEYAACNTARIALSAKVTAILAGSTTWAGHCPPEDMGCYARVASSIVFLEDVLIQLGKIKTNLDEVKDNITNMTNRANNLNLGIFPVAPLPLATRKAFAAEAVNVYGHSFEMHQYKTVAGTSLGSAKELIKATPVWYIVKSAFEDVNTLFAAHSAALGIYTSCTTLTVAKLIAVVIINMRGGNFGGGGGGLALTGSTQPFNSHPFAIGMTHTEDIGGNDLIEMSGRTWRKFSIGWEMPAGMYLDEITSVTSGAVFAAAGTSFRVFADISDNNPTFHLGGEIHIKDAHGLTLHYLDHANVIPGVPAPWAWCTDTESQSGGNEIVTGETNACEINLETTGTPTQIANGEKAQKHLTIRAMGGNNLNPNPDKYFEYDLIIEAPYEAPQDPCYEWDPYANAYVYNSSAPGCSGGSGSSGTSGSSTSGSSGTSGTTSGTSSSGSGGY